MNWTWDEAKNRSNRLMHRLSFEAAVFVFDDPLAIVLEDPCPHEQRWRTVGMVGTQVLMVVDTWPDFDTDMAEEVGRIISARKATRRERETYEEGLY